jgi:histidinol dehydrogenase
LQLAIDAPEVWLPNVQHAGAVFLGVDTAEVVGDYTAGPSHVLPTSGSARFASPLGVYDFQTRTSIIQCSREGAIKLSRAAAIIASEEGLHAHAESALARVKG